MARAAAVAVALALAAAAGCGSGSKPKTVQPAADWTKDVCGEVRSWASDQNARSRFLNRTISGVASFEEARTRMGQYMDDTIARTDGMLKGVKKAGRPDVAGGAEVASEFQTNLAELRPALEDARAEIDQLPSDLEGFKAGVKEISDAVETAEEKVADDLSRLATSSDHPALAKAFAAEPACHPGG